MPDGPSHKVSYPEAVREELKDLCRRAKQEGLATEILSAIKIIDEALRRDPQSFGCPTGRSRSGKLTKYLRIIRPLVVRYGVHESGAVFVKELKPFPDGVF